MRFLLIAFTTIIILSCQSGLPIEGKWKTTSKFYQATFQVYDKYIQTLSYNDGTYRYNYGNGEKKFFAKYLTLKDDMVIDAVAGATNTKKPPIKIEIINTDSLKVTTSSIGKPVTEIWTKIK